MAKSIRIVKNTLAANLSTLEPRLKFAVDQVMQYFATRAASDMRSGARWMDQTGNARQGLSAQVISTPTSSALILYHSVPYGVWLEIRWSGRYAIIGPTMNSIAPQLAAMLSQALVRLGAA